MAWYYLIYAAILIGASLCLINEEALRNSLTRIFLPLLFILLLCFAVSRSSSVDHDFQNYVDWFNRAAAAPLSAFSWEHDFLFFLNSWLVSSVGLPYRAVLLCYTALALISTFFFSRKTGNGRWLILLLYLIFCHCFIEYGMTAIRAAVAIPLASLSLLWAREGETGRSILLFIVALGFHLSVLIALPLFILFACGATFRSRLWIYSLIPTAIALYFIFDGLSDLLAMSERLAIYSKGAYEFSPISFLSVYFVVRLISLSTVIAFFWNKLSLNQRSIVFCSSVGLVLFISLSRWDTFAWRASEIFGLFDMAVFIIPLAHMKSTPRILYFAVLVVLGFVFYRSSLQLVAPYSF